MACISDTRRGRHRGFKQYIQFKSLAEYVVVKLPTRLTFRAAETEKARPGGSLAAREITKRKEFKNNWWKIAEQELGDT